MTTNRGQLVGLVSDPPIVRDRDAAVLTYVLEPFFVRAPGREKIMVPLDGQSSRLEYVRKALAEIAISEEDKAQAARS